MRLSGSRVRQHESKLIYPDHRFAPWLTEVAPRDRSNRLLGSDLGNMNISDPVVLSTRKTRQ
jgi:hypothetical protein